MMTAPVLADATSSILGLAQHTHFGRRRARAHWRRRFAGEERHFLRIDNGAARRRIGAETVDQRTARRSGRRVCVHDRRTRIAPASP